ncbi:MAG: S41 family peptidase [Ferruginibacter sp.]
MEKKKIQVWLPLLLSLSMIAGMYFGYKMRDGNPGKSFFFMEKRRPIDEILDLIQKKYVDTVNINMLADTAIEAMLSRLDPHSTFIPAKDLEQVNEEIAGSFFGIGIEFNMFDDSLHVVNVLKDGPGYKAGLKTGDKIIIANGLSISGSKISTDSIRKILRGARGTVVDLEFLRAGKKMTTQITRDIIPITSVDAAYMVDSIVGYIRLNKFSQQTYREFMENLEALKKKGMHKLMLDLRGNGGGVLEEAIEIADEFLDGDKLIAYTIGEHIPKKEYRCRREGQFEKGDVVVLCDEGTASASEILIGALQDWGRATIVGRTTFGKGLVQEQFDLSDKSALRLTIARYYTPIGRSIQRPYKNGSKAYYEEILNRYLEGRQHSSDSIKKDSTKMYTSSTGKKLFGGGGISPDLFVAADTGKMGIVSARIFTKGLMGDYGYRYFLKNRPSLEAYKSPGDFARSFEVSPENWKLFESFNKEDSIDISGISEKERNYLYRNIKTSIARQLWRNEGYFEVMNMEDNTVKKGMEVLYKK